VFLGDLVQRTRTLEGSVVEGDVEAAIGRKNEVDGGSDICIAGNIGPKECRAAAALLDLGDDFSSFFFAASGKDDLCTSLGESEGCGLADAGRAPGYQSDFVFVGVSFHGDREWAFCEEKIIFGPAARLSRRS